jgi:hypothetical protein
VGVLHEVTSIGADRSLALFVLPSFRTLLVTGQLTLHILNKTNRAYSLKSYKYGFALLINCDNDLVGDKDIFRTRNEVFLPVFNMEFKSLERKGLGDFAYFIDLYDSRPPTSIEAERKTN